MPQHAQERRTVKAARSAKMITAAQKNITLIRENVPVMALAAIAFGASYGHIVELFGGHGLHGWVKYAAAATVDLLCIIGAEERQRDKRIGRSRRWGFISWSTVVLVIGIAATLAANLATAEPGIEGWSVAAWSAVALLLAVSILERRTSHATVTEVPSTRKAPRKQAQESDGNAQGTPAEAFPVTPEPVAPETETAATVTGEGTRKRTDEEWLAEVRKLHAAQGDALSVRKLMPQLKLLGGGSGIAIAKATDMLRQVKAESETSQASEEAV